MKAITLEIGEVYGRLTVIGNTVVGRYSAAICRCECGAVKTIRRYSLTHGSRGRPTRSCGCLALEAARIALNCDRGSLFESPAAYAAHRKVWLHDYAKAYDSRPEQMRLRRVQAAQRAERMSPEQKARELQVDRLNASKPENRAKAKLAGLKYRKQPLVSERLKINGATYAKAACATLSDGYVADCFTQGSALRRRDVPMEIIEAIRASMQLKRKLKELQA